MTQQFDHQQKHLIKMINQIACNAPVREDVPGQIKSHLRQFWTPVMRNSLREIALKEPGQLHEAVHLALETLDFSKERPQAVNAV